jgi:hypothetical protein
MFLILSNIFTIIVALLERWSLSEVIWIYWSQNIIIGFYNWKRIHCLKQFSTEGFTINNQPVSPTKATQNKVAIFFALHYGFFHLVYLLFLLIESADISGLFNLSAMMCIIVFAINHRFSFLHNLEKDLNRKPNIGKVMLFPYARIIPMHLTILFGGFFVYHSAVMLVFFLSLKSLADLIMHLFEHREERKLTGSPSSESSRSIYSKTVD